MKIFSRTPAWVFALSLCASQPAAALTIDLDWDTGSIFHSDITARAAIQAAADDLSDAITSSLSGIGNGSINNGSYEWTTSDVTSRQRLSMTYTWNYFSNEEGIIAAELLPANTVKISVDGKPLSGDTLGSGGPLGSSFGWGWGWKSEGSSPTQSVFDEQADDLSAELNGLVSNRLMRGGGPIIGTRSGTITLEDENFPLSTTTDYSVSYGPAYGSLSLDTSYGNFNNGTPKQFEDYWHTDHTLDVTSGKNDLYSVALHEMLHAIGVGSSHTWDEMAAGNNWLGSNVQEEFGTGTNVITGNHIAAGLMSQVIDSGAMQEAVMDPNITTGTRKYLTALDLAFLRDLGYETITPEFGLQGDFNNDGLVNIADYTVWRDNLGAANETAINNNGNRIGGVTSADYAIWKANFGQSSSAISSFTRTATIPEPSSWMLITLLLGSAFLGTTRFTKQ